MRSRKLGTWTFQLIAVIALLLSTTATATASPAHSRVASAVGYGDWASWSHDLNGSRYAANETEITAGNVGRLKVKWAFAYPKLPFKLAKSQPAVVGGVVYFGSPDGKFYALNAATGATRWTFDLNTIAPGQGDTAVWDGPTVQHGKVIFGDHRGRMYALQTSTGALLWTTQLDSNQFAGITGSPVYYHGTVFVGVSSTENANGTSYPCCTFRGSVVALDADTGAVVWRYYTVPPPTAVGTWPSGATMFAPSGGAVWGTPAIDPATGTLYIGTGNNYTAVGPNHIDPAGDIDSLLALNAATGRVRWKRQMTPADTYRQTCSQGDPGFCPGLINGTALDYDVSAAPTVIHEGRRTLVGVGQKNGVYHMLDAQTGATVWERTLGLEAPDGVGGIQWGVSYDGRRLYIATWKAMPGTLFALDPATGTTLWSTPNPSDGCSLGGAAKFPDLCELSLTPAVTSSPGVVYEGSADGKMRTFSADTGAVLSEYDTVRDFAGVNGLTGTGSALSGNGGAVVSNGMMFVQSGYFPFYPTDNGYVLLAFGL